MDKELGLTVQKEGRVSTVLTQNSGTELVTEEIIDLSTKPSPASLQTPESMETQTSNKDGGTTEEKSSYEIAAEALCLMKFGGIKSFKEKQKMALKGGAQAQINVLDNEISHVYKSTEDKLVQNGQDVSLSSHMAGPCVMLTNPGNVQEDVSFANSHKQIDEKTQSNIESGSVVNTWSSLNTLTLPSENSNESQPSTHVDRTIAASSEELIKYVLVPESALLSTVRPGEIVSVPGTPYFFMMPKEKNQATKVLTNPESQDFTHRQRQLKPKCSAFTDSFNNSAISSAAVNISSNQGSSEELQNIEDQSHPTTTTETKTSNTKRSAKKHDSLKFPPCIICDGEASGFHYGCNTCEACKNFFRRCLLRKSNTPFICHGGKNCEISYKKNKNNCSACRLDKCLGMGMAKEKCKMGRYTALMRTETIKKVRILEGKDDENHSNFSEDSPGPDIVQEIEIGQQTEVASTTASSDIRDLYDAMISRQIYSSCNHPPEQETSNEYNEELVEYLVSAMEGIKPWGENLVTEESRKIVIKQHYEKYRAKVETFGQLNAVSMQEYQVLLRKFGIDIDGQWETFKQCTIDWEVVVGRYCRFAKCIPEFRALCFDDQACLLKATHFDFFLIVLHQGFIPEYGVFLEVNGVPLHVEEAANRYFSRELVLAMTDMMTRLQKMNLSKAEMALLISIVTMSSDQCNLENPTLVENTQLHLVDLLLRQTNRSYGQVVGRRRFTSMIDILTKMRDVSNIYYKEYRALCKDEFIRKEVPNFDFVLPEEN